MNVRIYGVKFRILTQENMDRYKFDYNYLNVKCGHIEALYKSDYEHKV